MKLLLRVVVLLFCPMLIMGLSAQTTPPDLVLDGKVTGAQNKTHFEIPFDVPKNIHRISVDFTYTGKQEQKTALNLGIADPERFRGNSGGNKSHFTISETDATPSYLPGAILPGQWKLLISVPNIRADQTSQYHAEIRFNNRSEDQGFAVTPLAKGIRWYRGDLHMHTAHSDGSCTSQTGQNVPCPVFVTVQTAASRGLDFIAITDHNTDSHYDAMRELQPFFDKILLIPGREMTTFWGHFNAYGVTQYVDYRAVANNGRDVNAIARDIRTKGGIVSVNHADSPGGEICMGCAWEPPTDVDFSLFTGVEVINGGRIMLSSADFWDKQLSKGIRLTAIGGSDNHNALSDPSKPGSIGWPTTVVEADELSVPAILEGIRQGRAFIDLTASHDKLIDLDARDRQGNARMGGILQASANESVELQIHVEACPRTTVHLILDGKELDGRESSNLKPIAVPSSSERLQAKWLSDGGRHWLRAEVRDDDGGLMLVSNPIYFNIATQ